MILGGPLGSQGGSLGIPGGSPLGIPGGPLGRLALGHGPMGPGPWADGPFGPIGPLDPGPWAHGPRAHGPIYWGAWYGMVYSKKHTVLQAICVIVAYYTA